MNEVKDLVRVTRKDGTVVMLPISSSIVKEFTGITFDDFLKLWAGRQINPSYPDEADVETVALVPNLAAVDFGALKDLSEGNGGSEKARDFAVLSVGMDLASTILMKPKHELEDEEIRAGVRQLRAMVSDGKSQFMAIPEEAEQDEGKSDQ
jgi:hypothetical protein